MNIVKQVNQFNENNLFFCQPIKNNIIENGVFIRILYKINTFVLNGIYLLLPLKDVRIEKYYNKQKYIFDINKNKQVLEKVKEIEETILKKAGIRNKSPLFKISENITHGNLKIINYNIQSTTSKEQNKYEDHLEEDIDSLKVSNDLTVMLKISGIWENENCYGVTFKCSKTMTEI